MQVAEVNGATCGLGTKPALAMNGPGAAVPKAEPSDSASGAVAPGKGSDGRTEEEVVEPPYSEDALDRLIQLASSGDMPTVRRACTVVVCP